MENGKSPGIDSIPIEFYKEFIETIKQIYKNFLMKYYFQTKKHQKAGTKP